MKRWAGPFLLVLLACLPLFFSRATSDALLADTDTIDILTGIQEVQNPWAWFTQDWPLKNHFYRPISTLFFELDHAVYGDKGAGWGLTNALLAIGCVLMLFWFLRELTDRPWLAAGGAVLFAFWTGDGRFTALAQWAAWGLAVLALVSSLLPGRRLRHGLLAALVAIFAAYEFAGIASLNGRMIHWIPGRTASIMTLFALMALALYARYERSSARRTARDPGPLDPPATKGTVVGGSPGRWVAALPVGAALGMLLALGSYEQAVMLPAVLLGVALTMKLQGYRVRWAWHVLFWGLLAAYLVYRQEVVPSDPSRYQRQQFRTGPGVWMSLLDYVFPAGRDLYMALPLLDMGTALFWSSIVYGTVLKTAANIAAYVQARRRLALALCGWALSVVTFLPMAWLKHFDHYHYWPMAMRSLFAVVVFWIALELTATGASLPKLQAPARPSPAPGSLPHQ